MTNAPAEPPAGHLAVKAVRGELYRAEGLMQSGRQREGEAVVEALLRAYPGYFTARTILAGCRFGEARYEEALALLEGALRLDPDNARLMVRIGQIENLLGFSAAAAARFHQALMVDPANLDASWELAQIDLADDDIEPAIDRLAALPPDFRAHDAAQTRLADAFERSGRSADAVAIYEQLFVAPQTPPADRSNAAFRLSTLASRVPDDALLRHLDGQVPPGERIAAGFARAALLMRRQDHAAAWHSLVAANHAKWAEVGEAVRAQQQTYPRILASCESASVTPLAADAPAPRTTPILIVGPSRSGKSLIEEVLSGFAGVARGFESDVIPAAIARTAQALDLPPVRDPWFLDAEAMPKLREEMQRLIDRRGRGAPYLTLTSPANVFHVGLVAQLFPTAPIIFVHRDRHDLALRIFATPYGTGHSYSYDLKSLMRYLDWHDAMAAVWTRKLGPRALTLRYEDLGSAADHLTIPLATRLGPRLAPPPEFITDAGSSTPYRDRIDAALG